MYKIYDHSRARARLHARALHLTPPLQHRPRARALCAAVMRENTPARSCPGTTRTSSTWPRRSAITSPAPPERWAGPAHVYSELVVFESAASLPPLHPLPPPPGLRADRPPAPGARCPMRRATHVSMRTRDSLRAGPRIESLRFSDVILFSHTRRVHALGVFCAQAEPLAAAARRECVRAGVDALTDRAPRIRRSARCTAWPTPARAVARQSRLSSRFPTRSGHATVIRTTHPL